MSLMTDLFLGASGLRASQYSLNTVAHNLSNVETEGFVRQQTMLKNSHYQNIGMNHISYLQLGRGVDTAEVRQIRDAFLDKTYRLEVGRQGFYEAQSETVAEIETLFGELQGVAFQDSLEDLWVSLQEIAKEPDSLVTQATVVETAISFLERADTIYRQLMRYQLNLNTEIENKVNRINELAQGIYELNEKIVKYESNGVENANDYRDDRNYMIDELGQLIKITYKEQMDGRITIQAEGVPLVSDETVFKMGYITRAQLLDKQGEKVVLDEMAQVLVPVWPSLDEMEVFNMDIKIDTKANTDIGSLKGILISRGTAVGKHTDIPIVPKKEDYEDVDGVLDTEAYNAAMLFYERDVMTYNKEIEPSVVMTVQAQFDQLIHGVVTTVNDILALNKRVKISAGETVTMENGEDYTFEEDTWISILDTEKAPVGLDEEKQMGIELFSRKATNRYLEPQDITLADGTTIENARIYRWEDPSDNYTLYTLGEIEVNPVIVRNKSKLPMLENDGTGDYDIATAERLLSAWQEPFATLSPNTLTYNNFNDYYTQFIGNIGSRGDEYTTLAKNQQSMVNSVHEKRLSIMAVASDEELTYMIKYQHAYNAAARYVNVISEMLEHIVTRL